MKRYPFWLWPNLLSVDAPIVALVWQDFLARVTASPLRIPGRLTLGLTVWAIYLLDRLIDVRSPSRDNETTRHRFYRANQRPMQLLFTLVVGVDLCVAVTWLRPEIFVNGLALAAAVAIYIALFVALRIKAYMKQVAASALFASGVFVVAMTNAEMKSLIMPALFFTGLCFWNMVLIEAWDGKKRIWLPWTIPGLLFFGVIFNGVTSWNWAILVSTMALTALTGFSKRIPTDVRRVLADVALLSPLLVW